MKSLRQGYGGKTPIVPPIAKRSKKKSSQGAKRTLTVNYRQAYLNRKVGKPPPRKAA